MNAVEILKALSQRPFKPFRLILTTGKEIPVLQQDTVLLNESKTTLATLERDNFYIVDLVHVVQMTFGGQATAEQLAG